MKGTYSSEAEIQTTHKCDFMIDETQLLVMGKVERDVVFHTVETTEC